MIIEELEFTAFKLTIRFKTLIIKGTIDLRESFFLKFITMILMVIRSFQSSRVIKNVLQLCKIKIGRVGDILSRFKQIDISVEKV